MTIPTPKEVPDWIRSVLILDAEDVWGQISGMGLGQLAVRLGYPGGFDNRGDVLFTDSFEEGLTKGVVTKGVAGAAVEVSTTSCRLGGFSLKLTAGSDGESWAGYLYALPYPTLAKVGAMCAFTVQADTEYIELLYSFYDGTYRHEAGIRYDHVNSKIQYKDAGLTWQDLITNVPLYAYDTGYHYLKVVIDLATAEYHRVLVDGYSWLIGELDYYHELDDTSPLFYCTLYHYGAEDANAVSYIDSVIFTQNEPL